MDIPVVLYDKHLQTQTLAYLELFPRMEFLDSMGCDGGLSGWKSIKNPFS